VAQHEGRGYLTTFGDPAGLTEDELAERLGDYNCRVGPSRTLLPDGGESAGDESELWYCLLLPRTVVSFVMAERRVVRVMFSPKVRRCLPGTEGCFGPLYASDVSGPAPDAEPRAAPDPAT
jgi:hypothetical protein